MPTHACVEATTPMPFSGLVLFKSGRYCIEKELDAIVLYYIDAEDSSYAFCEEDLSNDQEQDDTLDKVPITGSGPTLGTACCIPF
ncbi:hypothetical protein E2562_030032 [Oryza meyeriana var. granulata]|uniref:Uncharacterized protein n=1 Tax=Oryza meyeriana var. granulata TaxID=110450 RepID=A0A6G1EBZ2_9ORYZ|nr:hypothetical protein E2562_030032 [Oryza meyeriana var. granulata]